MVLGDERDEEDKRAVALGGRNFVCGVRECFYRGAGTGGEADGRRGAGRRGGRSS